MLPTPSTVHTNYDQVYEPAEDSFLFLDLLSSPKESAFLTERFQSHSTTDSGNVIPLIAEIGVGSGVVIAFVAAHAVSIFGRPHILTLGTDVNPFACRSSSKTVNSACEDDSSNSTHGFLGAIQADLAGAVRAGQIDVLIFNPPYVPSEGVARVESTSRDTVGKDFERDSALLALSYEGGVDGMEVTHRLLSQLPQILHPERGVAYILLCEQNRPGKVVDELRQNHPDWDVEVAARSGMKAGWEKLQIVRIACRRNKSSN